MARSAPRPPTRRRLLADLRETCLALPGAVETETFGNPTWQAGKGRTFCVLDAYGGRPVAAFKATPAAQAELLLHPAYARAPHNGRHGWTLLDPAGGVPPARVAELVEASYRLVARKSDLRALESLRLPRCAWIRDEAMRVYHDEEWGTPQRDETRLFELLSLSGAQAGLSWRTVLVRRAAYRELFSEFDVDAVARFTPRGVERLLGDERILRNRRKIESVVRNARAARLLRDEAGGLGEYLWSFVGGEPLVGRPRTLEETPAVTPLSEEVSADLKRRGFSFVGPTIVYAYLQSIGVVNDHVTSCFRFQELAGDGKLAP